MWGAWVRAAPRDMTLTPGSRKAGEGQPRVKQLKRQLEELEEEASRPRRSAGRLQHERGGCHRGLRVHRTGS